MDNDECGLCLGNEEVTINETKFNPLHTAVCFRLLSRKAGGLERYNFYNVRTLSYINLSLARRLVLR